MWFIAANKTTKAVLESGIRDSDFNDSNFLDNFLIALAANYSTPIENISLFSTDESSTDGMRLSNGDQFELIWSSSDSTGIVTGISFSIEDSKQWLQFSINKSDILSDGIEDITIESKVMDSDNLNIDTTFNGTIDIQISSPRGPAKMRFSFNSGIASKTLVTTDAGTWKIPLSSKRLSTYRVNNTVTFDSVL